MTPVLVHWDNFIGSRYMHAVHYCGCQRCIAAKAIAEALFGWLWLGQLHEDEWSVPSGLSLVANGWPT